MPQETKLPAEFADLQSLADQFAIGDDALRSNAEETATADQLRLLVDSVWPRFAEINSYLDENDDESANLLGRLAEAAAETAIDIGTPQS